MDMVKIDLVGQRFGRLVVTSECPERNGGYIAWVCQCDCGNAANVIGKNLKKGLTRSCGCLSNEKRIERSRTHGMSKTREYKIWKSIWKRCSNPESDWYRYYAGRGITVCDRWKEFVLFYSDMGPCPEKFSIERLDYDGNYEPSNCIWAGACAQAQNRRMFKSNVSGVTGVTWAKDRQKWYAYIGRNNEFFRLGYFEKLEDAIAARKEAEQRLDSRPLGENSTTGQSARR